MELPWHISCCLLPHRAAAEIPPWLQLVHFTWRSRAKEICYLDLQPLGDAEQYFSAGGNATFSDAIYALKSRKSNLIMKLESTLKTDSSGVDYFAPCKNAYDMRELKDEEIGRLLQAVAQLKEYEAIIVDVSGDLDERKLWLMQEYAVGSSVPVTEAKLATASS